MVASAIAAALCVVAFSVSAAGAQSATAMVHPREQVVLPGQTVSLVCQTGVPIQYCRIETPRGRNPLFLSEGMQARSPEEPVYYGEGYEKGQCGMTLQRASDRDNGIWKSSMGLANRAAELEATATITVARAPVQPQIYLIPSESSIGDGSRYGQVVGRSVHASCSIPDGRPPANLTWFIGDQPVTEGLSRLEYTNGTMTDTWTVSQNLTKEVTWQDHGKYLRCVSQHIALTNAALNESRVMLNVTYPPQQMLPSETEEFGFEVGKRATATVHPHEQVVPPGQNVSLLCQMGVPIQYCRIETPRGHKSLFLMEGMQAWSPEEPVYYGEGYEKGHCGMTLQRASDRDNGIWKCSMGLANRAVELEATATITVAQAPAQPQIYLMPSESSTGDGSRYGQVAGRSVHASCSIPDGRPPANLTWFIGDQPVTEGLSRLEYTNGTMTDTWTVSQNLTKEVTWQDHGKYLRCVSQHIALTNAALNESRVMLNVTYPPQQMLPSETEQFGFQVGKEGIIRVRIQANPMPRVIWEIEGQHIQEGTTDPDNHYQARYPMNMGEGTWEATLIITHVEEADISKHFTLRASNSCGSETYQIALYTSSEPAGGVSSSRNGILESSDTESADHGPTNKAKTP